MNMQNEHGYRSPTYYAVVIEGKAFRGWHAIYVGLGGMTFRKVGTRRDVKFEGGPDAGWMERCWAQFLAMLEAEGAPQPEEAP